MNKKLLIILTAVLVMAFAVPAFANFTGIGGAKDQTPAAGAVTVCNQADCPKAGLCGTGAACGAGGCGAAAQQDCGGCRAYFKVVPNLNQ